MNATYEVTLICRETSKETHVVVEGATRNLACVAAQEAFDDVGGAKYHTVGLRLISSKKKIAEFIAAGARDLRAPLFSNDDKRALAKLVGLR